MLSEAAVCTELKLLNSQKKSCWCRMWFEKLYSNTTIPYWILPSYLTSLVLIQKHWNCNWLQSTKHSTIMVYSKPCKLPTVSCQQMLLQGAKFLYLSTYMPVGDACSNTTIWSVLSQVILNTTIWTWVVPNAYFTQQFNLVLNQVLI